jgi:hypothetical protein
MSVDLAIKMVNKKLKDKTKKMKNLTLLSIVVNIGYKLILNN